MVFLRVIPTIKLEYSSLLWPLNSCYWSYQRFDIQTKRKGPFCLVLAFSPIIADSTAITAMEPGVCRELSRSCSFLSPEDANLLVSAKNCDLCSDSIFWACTEYSYSQLYRFVRFHGKSENGGLLVLDPLRGLTKRIAWDENTSCCFEHRGTYAQQSSNSIIPLLLSLDASSPPISTSWSRCIFFVFPNNRKFLKEKKNSFPKGQEFYDLESILWNIAIFTRSVSSCIVLTWHSR